MLNVIVVQGRFTKDPELRQTQNDNVVVNFTLAVERDYPNQRTNQREVDFIDVVAWGSKAEFVSKYFAKGQMAAVAGRLQIRNWLDGEGNKRRSAEIVAANVYFGSSKKSGGEGSNTTFTNESSLAASTIMTENTYIDEYLPIFGEDDEVPF